MLKKQEGFEGQVNIVLPMEVVEDTVKNPIINNLFITDIGYYPSAKYHHRSRPEGIEQHILIYALDGKGIIRMDTEEFQVLSNEFILIPAGTPHEYNADHRDPWSIYWIHFRGEKSHLFSKYIPVPGTIESTPDSRIPDRINLFRDIIDNLSMGYSRENIEYSNMCLWHLLASFTHIQSFRSINRTGEHDLVKRAILFMKSNIDRKLSLGDMARHVDLSASHFTRLFSLRTRTSPVDYLIHLKIQYACQLLDFTDLRISEVASETGYSDPYYFSRLFSGIMGKSPSRYRHREKRMKA